MSLTNLSIFGDSIGGGPASNMTTPPPHDVMDIAARTMEKMMSLDSNTVSLHGKLTGGGGGVAVGSGVSGLQDRDYPASASSGQEAAALKQGTIVQRVPLPPELQEHFNYMQVNCNMGLFTQVSRAWLTIDSDIYVWKYEDGGDVAFYDGLKDIILKVCIITPRPGILQPHIKYLLCLATPTEIVMLGVSFSIPPGGGGGEMNLLPQPLFTLATEGLYTTALAGTANGRLFIGGQDGCLYEFVYRGEEGWFGKKTKKVNHSSSTLSWVMPSLFSGFAEEDPITQIAVDDSRNILYTRSEKGTVSVYDLGVDGESMIKVTSVSSVKLVEDASRLAATVETSNLKPITRLAVVPKEEDEHVHVVAITGGGARFYLSTRNPSQNLSSATAFSRPYCLKLLHVRLPPGFSPSAPAGKPTKVHNAYYKSGLSILASSIAEASDVLWLIWNGCLPPSGHVFMESQDTIQVDGFTWAVDEIPEDTQLIGLYRNSFGGREPSTAVIQHCSNSRRMIVLTNNCSILISALRPVDCLRQLMIDCGGPEAEAVKAYFCLQGQEHAVATALVLATSTSIVDKQVGDWATRALYLYGGDPRLVYGGGDGGVGGPGGAGGYPGYHGAAGFLSPGGPNATKDQLMYHPGYGQAGNQGGAPHAASFLASPSQSAFLPNIISTPAPGMASFSATGYGSPLATSAFGGGLGQVGGAAAGLHQTTHMPELQFSGRHNGLYLFLSRILRPVWALPLVSGPADRPTTQITEPYLEFIIGYLHKFRTFLERQTLGTNTGNEQLLQLTQLSQLQQRNQQDALLREKQSLINLKQLVAYSLQVLGLWRIVVEHQLEFVIVHLSDDKKNQLRQLLFRDILVTPGGRDLACDLVQCLVQRYLGDSACTDTISQKLRNVCPSLYRVEDAAGSKVHELLLAARQQNKPAERDRMVSEAVTIAKQIAATLKLDVTVSHLTSVHAYTAVVDICLAAATKRDPQGVALHYYKSGENTDDTAGLSAYLARSECYRHCTDMLKTLLEHGRVGPASPSIPASPGPPPPPDPAHLPPSQAKEWAEQVFHVMVNSEDQLLHVALYQWLIENKFIDRLLNIRSPYIEEYLKMGTVQHPETIEMFDLLWKYYEKNDEYVSAAKILSKLSDKHSNKLTLNQRVEYLSRAIMCVKSGKVGGSSGGGRMAGELLHHLEEKMEVARVQLMVLDAVSNLPSAANSIARLNSDLLDITTLYQDWAEPYQLWECKLAILACAGHYDPLLIETIWSNILEAELAKVEHTSGQNKLSAISRKMESLGRLYYTSTKYFPLEFLVKQLELLSCREKGSPDFFLNCLQDVGVDLPMLLDVYNRIYLAKEPIWLTSGDDLHVLKVLCCLLKSFANNPSSVALAERRQFTVVCQDLVSTYLGELYMRQSQETGQMISTFRDIQAVLDRM